MATRREVWVGTPLPSVTTPAAIAAAAAVGSSLTYAKADHTHGGNGDVLDYTEAVHNKVQAASRTVATALDDLNAAHPVDVSVMPATGVDRVTNVGTITPFTNVATMPAASVAGTMLKFRFAGIVVSKNAADTIILTLKMGASTFMATTAASPTAGTVFVIEGWVVVQVAGAGGTVTGLCYGNYTWGAGSPMLAGKLPPDTSINMSGATTVTCNVTWSSAHVDNQIDLKLFQSEVRLVGAVT